MGFLRAKDLFGGDEGERLWPQIYSILTVCMNSITTGQLVAWPSPSIPILTSPSNAARMTMEEASYLTIIPAITAIFAAPFVGKLIDIVGRKYALLSVTIPYCISWILVAIGGNMYVYYASRVFNGIGDACCFSTIPCYVTEVATPKVRGTWGNAVSLTIFCGQFLMNIIGGYLSISNAAYVSLILPLVFVLNFAFIPESPYYLLMRGRQEEAKKTLQWLRGKTNVEDELTQLAQDVQRQLSETGRFVDLYLIRSNRRACLIGILIRAAQQFTGISAFTVFAQTIFIESGSDISARMSAIVFSGFLFTCTSFASLVLNRLGRRRAMLISCVGSCLVLTVQTSLFYIKEYTDLNPVGFEIFPLVSMIAFVLVYSVGLGIVPTMMLGELFSSSIKGKAFILMNIFFGLSIASSAKIFAICIDVQGLFAGFCFLAACSCVSIVIAYFFVPETSGKTLEQIQQEFKK